jgi:DNA-directed RNA polymerase subunit RPC12/RpoP
MDTRLPHLAYRCLACTRLLTRLEILAEWDRLERTQEQSRGICPCGSNRISPTNVSLWEELTIPRVWKLWWSEIVLPWWRSR